MANLSSDIFDIAAYINQIKKDHIDEDESTLLLGIFGYLGDVFSKITQNSIIMAAETSNEGIGVKARYEKNIIAHAFTAGVQNIYAIPSTMEVLMAFNEAELFPTPDSSSVTVQRFVFDSNNKIFFGNFEFHPEYNILITKTKLNNDNYAYSAQYYIEKDSNNNDKYNPISDISSTGIYLSPPSIIRGANDVKILYIQIPLRQSERYIINKKVVTNNIIESKVFSFDFSAQLAGFTVDIQKADGTNLRLVPVYDGIATDEKQYLYYQFMSTNFIRCKFVDSIYMPAINDQIIINLQTSQGYSGNFYWNPEKYLRFVFDSTKYGLMNQDGSFDGYNAINCQIIPVSTEATGGLDKKSVEELRTIIAKENLARNSITSLTDLKNFFNQINNDMSQVYTYKRRDNQFERLYYVYLLMKNELSNIVPMNTISFNVHQTQDNISSDGEIVNVNKNDIIEYFLDRESDPDHPVTYGEIINENIDDPDMFGSQLYTISNNRTPNYKSDTYYIKKHYIAPSGTTYYSDKECTTSVSTLASDTYATNYNGYYTVVVSDNEYYVKSDDVDKSWYFYDTDPDDIIHRYKLTSGLESIGIEYDGISSTLIIDYNYSYSSAVNVRLPAGDSVLLNNKAFKEKINAIEGTYNFLYTKYATNPVITKTSAANIYSVSVDLSVLGSRLDLEGSASTQTFKFEYDINAAVWKIYGTSTTVELSNYGISYVGTPSSGSTIQVVVDVNVGWTLKYSLVDLSEYGFIEVGSAPYEIGNKITVSFYYNNNYVYVDKSTTSFYIDDIIVDKSKFRVAINDDVTANHVFIFSNYSPGDDNLFTSVENTDEGGGIIAEDVNIVSSSSFYSAIYNDPANGFYNEGIYRFKCLNVIMDPNNIINTSTWADLQSSNSETDSGYNEYTFSSSDTGSTLTTKFGISIKINDYYAPAGTSYYSDTALTTLVGTLTEDTNLDPPTNNRYFVIDISGTDYYIDTNDVEKGKRRALKEGDTIDITYTMWVDGSNQYINLNDYGITLISSKPVPGDTLTFRLHMSTINMEKDSNLFYYECPYDLSINKNPLIAYYKLSSFNMEKRLNFNYINNNAVYQFIAQYLECDRSYINNKNVYNLIVKAKLNVEDVENLITVYGDRIVSSKIKCMLWLYDSKEETFPSRYTFGNLINYNEEEYIFTYEFKLETDNQINQENRLSLTGKELYVAGTTDKYGQYFDNNIKAEIVFAFESENRQETTQSLFDVVPSLNGYLEANSYFVNDGLDLFFNFSELINSKVTAELEPGLPIYKALKDTLYFDKDYIKVDSGTTYYSDADCLVSAGTTSDAVKAYQDGDDYKINIPVSGVMTPFYVTEASTVYVDPSSADYFDPTMAVGALTTDYSSESTTGHIIITDPNDPDCFDPDDDYCPIKTPSNEVYYVETDEVITLNRYYYALDEIPCIRHNYITDEDIALEFLEKIISEKNYLEYCVSVIEDNFSVDFKFFNTYGPSYLYTTDQDGKYPIDKTNISLVFNLKLNSNYDNNIVDLIIQDIKGYIEDITKISNLHMNNLTNFIYNKYSDSIEFFEFISINGQTSWKHIYSQQEDDSGYYVSIYPPEFLNVNNKEVVNSNYISVEPDITINLV